MGMQVSAGDVTWNIGSFWRGTGVDSVVKGAHTCSTFRRSNTWFLGGSRRRSLQRVMHLCAFFDIWSIMAREGSPWVVRRTSSAGAC